MPDPPSFVRVSLQGKGTSERSFEKKKKEIYSSKESSSCRSSGSTKGWRTGLINLSKTVQTAVRRETESNEFAFRPRKKIG